MSNNIDIENTNVKEPSLLIAILPLLLMAASLIVGVGIYGTDPHIPIFVSAFFATIIAMSLGHTWGSIQKEIFDTIYSGMLPLIIIMLIGAFIGVWINAGIVPSIVYYGMDFLSPTWFLLTASILSMLVGIVGGAWLAAGTVGLALISIAEGLGIPLEITAGAIVSGVYIGGKISPLSDTPNLVAGVISIDVFTHIKNMLYTTIPAMIISFALYIIIGFKFSESSLDTAQITSIQNALSENFTISPLLIIPFIFIILIFILKIPAIPGMSIGVMLGAVIAFFVQGSSIGTIFTSMYLGMSIESNNEVVSSLLNQGGIASMELVVTLFIIALAFGAIIKKGGMLDVILFPIAKKIKRTGSLVTLTGATCYVSNAVGCDKAMGVIVPGKMFIDEYKSRGLHPKFLSRNLEDCGTVMAPLIPWSTDGIFIFSILGVSPLAYGPYAFFCYVCTFVAIFFAYFNIKTNRIEKEKVSVTPKSV